MPIDAASPASPAPSSRLAAAHRWAAILVLGFASGLPLALTGLALQAWLTMDGLDMAAIGFLTLIGIPYTFKFLWAPLMDRVDLPLLGRRRGWIAFTQALLAVALFGLADISPVLALPLFAALGVGVAFVSASQDIVVDAYRVDLLPARERGIGASLFVMGYRIAMILSGGVALIWTDAVNGVGMSWPDVYRLMAALMAGLAVFSAIALPRLAQPPARVRDASRTPVRQDLVGFLAVLAAVAVGVGLTQRFGGPIAGWLLSPWFGDAVAKGSLQAKWIDLLALLLGLAVTLPLAGFAARRARFQTLLAGLDSYFSQPRAWAFLAFIVFYKLTDAFQLSLLTPFLLKGMAFGPAEVGVVNKLVGLLLTVVGALLGGLVMLRLRLAWSLLLFGLLQMSSSLAFWWLAVHGKGVLPGWTLPAFDFGFVKLLHPTLVDGGLLMAVATENLASGMGTAAFLAFLMSLTNQRFSATQFALLSAFQSVGRVWIGPLAGVLSEAIGWPAFFLVALVMGVPSLILLKMLWATIDSLDVRR
ncbi:MAG: MFS transporter [Burkholderiaceae bacterium]|jgi:PAT family beta-lactamase induction signal transducer AmpG